MGKRRKAAKAMMDAVEAGEAFAIHRNDKPVAMVIPWADWDALNKKLALLALLIDNAKPEPEDGMRQRLLDEADTRDRMHWGTERTWSPPPNRPPRHLQTHVFNAGAFEPEFCSWDGSGDQVCHEKRDHQVHWRTEAEQRSSLLHRPSAPPLSALHEPPEHQPEENQTQCSD